MRLLQLNTSPAEVLDLHPNVSIVTGLDAEGRGLLIDAVERLARAEAVSGTGLLEAHGVLFDLEPDLLNLIEVTEDVDPIVRAGQLPTQPVSLDARELRSREDAFAVLLELISAQAEKQSAARTTLAAASAALERAHAARAEAVSSSQRRDDDMEGQARRLEELADDRRRVRGQLEEARGDLEEARGRQSEVVQRSEAIRAAHDAAASLRAGIETELATLDAAPAEAAFEPLVLEPIEPVVLEPIAVEPVVLEPIEVDPIEVDPIVLEPVVLNPVDEARAEELEQLLIAIAPVERTAVEQALAAMVGDGAGDDQVSPEALRLADSLDDVASELDRLTPAGEGDDGAPSAADARVRLDEARQALLEAEQAVRTPELDRDDVLKLEDIHGELIEAIDKADGRFGRARAASRVTELREAEQEVLDRLGFTSYSAYMMGYSLNDTDPAKEAELDRARAELAEAEDAWALIAGASEDELEQAATLDRRRELHREAALVLGHEVTGPPQAQLRALRITATPQQGAVASLRAALDAVGIDLADEELDHEELMLIGQAWLSEADESEARRRAAMDELAALRGGGHVETGPVETGPVEVEADQPEPASDPTDDAVPVDRVEADADPDPDPAADPGAEHRGSELARDLATARDMEQSAADTLVGTDEEQSAAAAEVAELEAAVARLTDELTALDVAVAEVEAALSGLTEEIDLTSLDMQLESAKAVHAEAQAAMEVIDQAMATLDAEGRAEAQDIERLQDTVAAQETGIATPAEELEWYLLARLAAQRSVSIAGSVPLLLDDALSGLGIEEACHLLTRLERMADVVQVIVVSDDPVVATWALTTGSTRAAVVSPGAA